MLHAWLWDWWPPTTSPLALSTMLQPTGAGTTLKRLKGGIGASVAGQKREAGLAAKSRRLAVTLLRRYWIFGCMVASAIVDVGVQIERIGRHPVRKQTSARFNQQGGDV